jgi:hypothetical protein
MADLRSLSTVLETDLKQSKGVVGWGTFQSLTYASAVLSSICGRYSKNDFNTRLDGLAEGGGANDPIVRDRRTLYVSHEQLL